MQQDNNFQKDLKIIEENIQKLDHPQQNEEFQQSNFKLLRPENNQKLIKNYHINIIFNTDESDCYQLTKFQNKKQFDQELEWNSALTKDLKENLSTITSDISYYDNEKQIIYQSIGLLSLKEYSIFKYSQDIFWHQQQEQLIYLTQQLYSFIKQQLFPKFIFHGQISSVNVVLFYEKNKNSNQQLTPRLINFQSDINHWAIIKPSQNCSNKTSLLLLSELDRLKFELHLLGNLILNLIKDSTLNYLTKIKKLEISTISYETVITQIQSLYNEKFIEIINNMIKQEHFTLYENNLLQQQSSFIKIETAEITKIINSNEILQLQQIQLNNAEPELENCLKHKLFARGLAIIARLEQLLSTLYQSNPIFLVFKLKYLNKNQQEDQTITEFEKNQSLFKNYSESHFLDLNLEYISAKIKINENKIEVYVLLSKIFENFKQLFTVNKKLKLTALKLFIINQTNREYFTNALEIANTFNNDIHNTNYLNSNINNPSLSITTEDIDDLFILYQNAQNKLMSAKDQQKNLEDTDRIKQVNLKILEKEPSIKMISYQEIGEALLHLEKFTESIEVFNLHIQNFEEKKYIQNYLDRAYIHHQQALAYSQLGSISKALECLELSFTIYFFKELNSANSSSEPDENTEQQFMNALSIYMKDIKNAETFFQQWNNRAENLFQQKKYQLAINYYKRSEILYKSLFKVSQQKIKITDWKTMTTNAGKCHYEIGIQLKQQKQFVEAEFYINQAMKYDKLSEINEFDKYKISTLQEINPDIDFHYIEEKTKNMLQKIQDTSATHDNDKNKSQLPELSYSQRAEILQIPSSSSPPKQLKQQIETGFLFQNDPVLKGPKYINQFGEKTDHEQEEEDYYNKLKAAEKYQQNHMLYKANKVYMDIWQNTSDQNMKDAAITQIVKTVGYQKEELKQKMNNKSGKVVQKPQEKPFSMYDDDGDHEMDSYLDTKNQNLDQFFEDLDKKMLNLDQQVKKQ